MATIDMIQNIIQNGKPGQFITIKVSDDKSDLVARVVNLDPENFGTVKAEEWTEGWVPDGNLTSEPDVLCFTSTDMCGSFFVNGIVSSRAQTIKIYIEDSTEPIDFYLEPDVSTLIYIHLDEYIPSCNASKVRVECKYVDAITSLDCSYSYGDGIDISNLTGLQSFTCDGSSVRRINASNLTALTTLNCQMCQTLSVDVSNCTSLTTLNCSQCSGGITLLNLTNCTSLTEVNAIGSYPIQNIIGNDDGRIAIIYE